MDIFNHFDTVFTIFKQFKTTFKIILNAKNEPKFHYLLTAGLDFEKCDVQLRCFSINSLLFSLRSGFSGLELLSYLVTTTPFTFGSELDRYFSVSPEVADPFNTLTPFGTAFLEYTVPFTCMW